MNETQRAIPIFAQKKVLWCMWPSFPLRTGRALVGSFWTASSQWWIACYSACCCPRTKWVFSGWTQVPKHGETQQKWGNTWGIHGDKKWRYYAKMVVNQGCSRCCNPLYVNDSHKGNKLVVLALNLAIFLLCMWGFGWWVLISEGNHPQWFDLWFTHLDRICPDSPQAIWVGPRKSKQIYHKEIVVWNWN